MAFVIKMFANKKNTQSTTRHSESTSSMKHERPSCIQKLHDRLYWRGYWLQNHLCRTDQPSYVINTYNWYYQHTLTAALLTTLDMWHNGEDIGVSTFILGKCNHHNHFTAFFWDHPGEPVPEENFWTLWCKRRLTEADTDHPAGCHSIRTNQWPPPPNSLLINTVPAKHSSIPKKQLDPLSCRQNSPKNLKFSYISWPLKSRSSHSESTRAPRWTLPWILQKFIQDFLRHHTDRQQHRVTNSKHLVTSFCFAELIIQNDHSHH